MCLYGSLSHSLALSFLVLLHSLSLIYSVHIVFTFINLSLSSSSSVVYVSAFDNRLQQKAPQERERGRWFCQWWVVRDDSCYGMWSNLPCLTCMSTLVGARSVYLLYVQWKCVYVHVCILLSLWASASIMIRECIREYVGPRHCMMQETKKREKKHDESLNH